MFRTNKVLIIIFVVILLIVFGELGYYFFYQNTQKNITNKASITQFIPKEELNKTEKKGLQYFTFLLKKAREKNIPYVTLAYLLGDSLQSKKETITSIIRILEAEGKIVSIDKNEGIIQPADLKYKFQLKIEKENDLETTTFFYSEEQLPVLTIVKINNSKEESISFNNLNIGDRVRIKEVYNIKKNYALVEAKITRF